MAETTELSSAPYAELHRPHPSPLFLQPCASGVHQLPPACLVLTLWPASLPICQELLGSACTTHYAIHPLLQQRMQGLPPLARGIIACTDSLGQLCLLFSHTLHTILGSALRSTGFCIANKLLKLDSSSDKRHNRAERDCLACAPSISSRAFSFSSASLTNLVIRSVEEKGCLNTLASSGCFNSTPDLLSAMQMKVCINDS